jgi:hypothetical protein
MGSTNRWDGRLTFFSQDLVLDLHRAQALALDVAGSQNLVKQCRPQIRKRWRGLSISAQAMARVFEQTLI